MTKMCSYTACQEISDNVKQEHERVKVSALKYSVATHWNSEHDEVTCADANQRDVDVAWKRIKAPGGVDEKLREQEEEDKEEGGIPTVDDWEIWAQYEGGMQPMKNFVLSAQSKKVIAHMELFNARSTIELISAPFFLMAENVSAKDGNRGGSNLTVSVYAILD